MFAEADLLNVRMFAANVIWHVALKYANVALLLYQSKLSFPPNSGLFQSMSG
jgi:hypothetical protein